MAFLENNQIPTISTKKKIWIQGGKKGLAKCQLLPIPDLVN